MHIVRGDLWEAVPAGGGQPYRVITTNRSVRRDGAAVMGRGTAAQAVRRYPWLPTWYGEQLRMGRRRAVVCEPARLVLFPVKEAWSEPASREIISESLSDLLGLEALHPWLVMPLPGAGFGELPRAEVLDLVVDRLAETEVTLVLRGAEVARRYPDAFRASRWRRDRLQ